uniref:hypothetical protein n=1 Tax=uncultured Helicobacter sp. TaxID=175537 RepID=UPI0026193890
MAKDFKDFINGMDKTKVKKIINDKLSNMADENNKISLEQLTEGLFVSNFALTLEILKAYHEWLHQDED